MVLFNPDMLFHMGQPDKAGVPIWNDRAGGYGIQDPFGAMAVRRIKGDYYNVVGLPLYRLCPILRDFGLELPMDDNLFLVNLDVID